MFSAFGMDELARVRFERMIERERAGGYMCEYQVEQLARDAKAMQIYGGTDEIQISAIARDLLAR
jgi:hypothetical protein